MHETNRVSEDWLYAYFFVPPFLTFQTELYSLILICIIILADRNPGRVQPYIFNLSVSTADLDIFRTSITMVAGLISYLCIVHQSSWLVCYPLGPR